LPKKAHLEIDRRPGIQSNARESTQMLANLFAQTNQLSSLAGTGINVDSDSRQTCRRRFWMLSPKTPVNNAACES
jgi:hypothetical protein